MKLTCECGKVLHADECGFQGARTDKDLRDWGSQDS
jgi:hypothetical protein